MTEKNIINLPVVTFDYPNSATNRMTQRFVATTLMDSNYIMGYELQNLDIDQAICSGYKFKKYSLDRIANNGVVMIGYEPKIS